MFAWSVSVNSCDAFCGALHSITFLLHFLFLRAFSFPRLLSCMFSFLRAFSFLRCPRCPCCLSSGELPTSRGIYARCGSECVIHSCAHLIGHVCIVFAT